MISRWLKRTFIISWDDRRAKRWHLRWHYFLLSKNTENVSIHPWKTLLSYYLNTRTQGGHPASVWTVEPVYNLTRGTDRHQSWTPTLQCNTNLCPSTSPSWISFYWSHSVIMEKILWIKMSESQTKAGNQRKFENLKKFENFKKFENLKFLIA